MSKRKITEEFIEEAKKVHGDKYDYSKVEYTNSKAKVCIICPEHGEFWQTPSSHLRGCNCPVCSKFEATKKTAIKLCIYNSYETIKKYASKCLNRHDFFKKYRKAWLKSKQNGWLDDFFPINQKEKNAKIHYVYVYPFEKTNSVYIGRTNNPFLRDKQHHESGTVYNYSIKTNTVIPNMLILRNDLTIDESLKYEDEILKEYKKKGYSILNIAKTGVGSGSIGSFGHGKLNDKYCFDKAKECNSLTELHKKYPSVENKARKKGWLKNYTWFVHKKLPNGYWKIYENNYQKAREYPTRGEFQKGCISAYNVARKNGWLDDYYWFKPSRISNYKGYWNVFENVEKESKKYSSKTQFSKGNSGAYVAARRNNWLDKLFPYQKFVQQIDRQGNIVAILKLSEAVKQFSGHISDVCNGKRKTACGYIWNWNDNKENI